MLVVVREEAELVGGGVVPLLLLLPLLFLLTICNGSDGATRVVGSKVCKFLSSGRIATFTGQLHCVLRHPVVVSVTTGKTTRALIHS